MLLDAINAYFNALQDGNVVVQPPKEWIQAQKLAGNVAKTLWKLKKKLYGQRDASKGFSDFMVGVLVGEMKLVQCMDQPCFFRDDANDVVLELHQDDIYATGPKEGLENFVEEITKRLAMKVSKPLGIGSRYAHLKAGRVRTKDGMYLVGNRKYADEIVKSLGLEGAKPAATPITTKLLPEDLEEMCSSEEVALYRLALALRGSW